MIPLRDNQKRNSVPVLTLTLIALNVIVFLWDRQGHLFGPSIVFADIAMRPADVVNCLRGAYSHGSNPSMFPLVTILTSMFMHGSVMHIVGNMIFLIVFGPGVEDAIGGPRFALYYLAWGIFATAAQISIDPQSPIPTLGASGAIGGVLGAYWLLFPANKIQIFIPFLPLFSFMVSAWLLLGFWFLWQVFVPQNGVANWAHVGGFLAGMLTVLVMGGRASVLKGRNSDYELA